MSHRPVYRLQYFAIAAAVLSLSQLSSMAAWGQVRETTFGIERMITTPDTFDCVKRITLNAGSSVDLLLWKKHSHRFYVAHVDSSCSSLAAEHYTLPGSFDDILLADVNRDQKMEFVFVSRLERTVSVVEGLSGDTLTVANAIALPFTPTGWATADINNDGNPDLLLYDRNNPGIVPLFSNGKGKFKVGPVIAPDLAAGCLAVTHLNNDDLTDLVVYDWVKSKLHLLYGVGRGRFLDQSTFPVQGEVDEILPARLEPAGFQDLVIVGKHPAEVQDWKGNGIGDFRLAKRGLLGDTLVSCGLADCNGDQWVDFGYVNSTGTLQVLLNNGEDWSTERIQFSAGNDPSAVVFDDFNHDQKTDALVLDRAGTQLRFYFNSAQVYDLADSLEFATAPNPTGLVVHCIDNDTLNDIVVASALGRSLSIFANRGATGLSGQTSFSLSVGPSGVSYHSSTDSSARFVLTSSAADSLLLFSLNFKDSSSSYAIIPGEGSADLVQSGLTGQGQVEFMTFNTFTGGQEPDIHYYERLDPGTFIEQSFRLEKPDALLGATAAFLNGDKFPDLIYVHRNVDSGNVDLSVSYGDSLMAYAQRQSIVPLPPEDTTMCYLWAGSYVHPDTVDLLIYFADPVNTLALARGKGGGQFEEPVVVLQHIRLETRSMLQYVDADNDGYGDILLNNAEEHSLGWLRGEAGGRTQPWVSLIPMGSNDQFATGDVNGDGVADVVVTRAARGTVVLFNGARLFRKGDRANDR